VKNRGEERSFLESFEFYENGNCGDYCQSEEAKM